MAHDYTLADLIRDQQRDSRAILKSLAAIRNLLAFLGLLGLIVTGLALLFALEVLLGNGL